jgi:hypothetical protein
VPQDDATDAAEVTAKRPDNSRLEKFAGGHLQGMIAVDAAMRALGAATVEVFAHGITVATGAVPLGGAAVGDIVAFDIPARQFPRVDLPCPLTARVVETDTELETRVEVRDLDGLWQAMLPWRATIEGIEAGRVIVTLPTRPAQPEAVIFDLYEAGEAIGASTPDGPSADGGMRYAIDLPAAVIDGAEHRLTVIHRGSNLAVGAEPLFVVLQSGRAAQLPPMTAQQLAERMNRIETQMRERYAEAFNGLAAQLYQHVDRVALRQRANFEREVSALRRTLGLVEPETRPAPLPERVHLAFAGEVIGYGVHRVQVTGTGKSYRDVSPRCGILLPALVPGAARLVVQGIRRSHDGALDGARLVINGTDIPVVPYVNPRGESWNITVRVPGAALRGDRNLLELRLPAGPAPGAVGAAAEIAVGILEITLTAEAAAGKPADNAAAAKPAADA